MYFNEMLLEIQKFPFTKMHLEMSSGKMATILSLSPCVNCKRIAMTDCISERGNPQCTVNALQGDQLR